MSKESNSYKNSPKKVYIRTFGCQMNEYDSLVIKELLAEKGFQESDDISSADIVILETCSVRKKAEDKVLGLVGQLAKKKQTTGKPFIVVSDCMAERMKKDLRLLKEFMGIL